MPVRKVNLTAQLCRATVAKVLINRDQENEHLVLVSVHAYKMRTPNKVNEAQFLEERKRCIGCADGSRQ